jgi:hypothetical protein
VLQKCIRAFSVSKNVLAIGSDKTGGLFVGAVIAFA